MHGLLVTGESAASNSLAREQSAIAWAASPVRKTTRRAEGHGNVKRNQEEISEAGLNRAGRNMLGWNLPSSFALRRWCLQVELKTQQESYTVRRPVEPTA